MGRASWLLLFGLAVFVVALVWTMPLAFVAQNAGLAQRGILYERAQGTVWSGDLLGVTLAGQPIGKVTLLLDPVGLLKGSFEYDMDVAGPAGRARGDVSFGLGGQIGIRDMVADINVQALQRLDPRLRQVPATVSLTLPALAADHRLACQEADGRVRTDLLEKLGAGLQWTGPAMAGVISCGGDGGYQILLGNEGGEDEITVTADGSPLTVSYQAEARVKTRNRTVADTLALLGFQRVGDEFVYSRANGVIRSIGEAG